MSEDYAKFNLAREKELLDKIDRLTRELAEAARAPLAEENARLKERIERMNAVMEGMRSFWNEDHDELENAKSRIAELEAENQTLTRECADAEDESGRLEEELQKEQDENDRLRAEVEALTAANATLMESVYFARDIAMIMTAKARIPECAEFAKIAQELDAAIAARKGAAKEPTPE